MAVAQGILVVTGGSRGIGAAVALLGAKEGYDVAIACSGGERSASAVVSAIGKHGRRAKAYAIDVSDAKQVAKLFADVQRDLGAVSALVTAAGITGGARPILDSDPAVLEKVVAVNLLGTLYCVREAAAHMARSRGGVGGAIVTVSSEAAKFGGNRLPAYAASKAGVSTLTIGLARELADEGIRLNAVSPGVIDTEQHAGQPAERTASLLASIPMKRMGTPEEVAAAALWLLSPAASYVTGSILSIHGGR